MNKRFSIKIPELLVPAGNLEKLKFAIAYGADAVYLGGKEFSLRKAAGNFSLEEMNAAVQLAHKKSKKVYITVNAFARNRDVIKIDKYLRTLKEISVDAIIVSDPGILYIAKEIVPDIPIHMSTQANTLNVKSVEFWEQFDVKRVCLARELCFEEIKHIKDKSEVEIEVFVHGAMCVSYSGRCLLSKYLANRDSNLGDCAQSCRWKYAVVEEKREGQFYPIEESSNGTYIFNSKDLCLLKCVSQLINIGVDSFKIEGRMRSIHYLATVTKVYRDVIDTYCNDPESFILRQEWKRELENVSHRPYTIGFMMDKWSELEATDNSSPVSKYEFVGLVLEEPEDGLIKVRVKNGIEVSEKVEVLQPKGKNIDLELVRILDSDGLFEVKKAYENHLVFLPIKKKIEKYSILRRKKDI